MRIRVSICLFLILTLAGCVRSRLLPPIKPLGAEAHFVRTCEAVEAEWQQGLKTQGEALGALRAISPQGRICFVCQRLRRCATAQRRQLTAREISAEKFASDPRRPPPGGPQLWEVLDYACAVCADQPRRIRDTSMHGQPEP